MKDEIIKGFEKKLRSTKDVGLKGSIKMKLDILKGDKTVEK